jgi:uncharacterized membrane protein
MKSARLEAFTDAVIAIIITIMVIEFKAPEETDFNALVPLIPKLLSYLMSFVFLGVYWNNHHHLFHVVEKVDGGILWANLHVLFWLSLVPFSTSWLGEHYYESAPAATYGALLLMISIASALLNAAVARIHGEDSLFKSLSKTSMKQWLTVIFYVAGVALSYLNTIPAVVCYVLGTALWFIPDTRVEKVYK